MRRSNILICAFLSIAILFIGAGTASAAEIRLVLDTKYVYTDTPPALVDGRVLVPARAILEALGGTVEWNPEKQEVFGYRGAKRVWMYIDSIKAYYGNRDESTLDVPAQIINGRTMVPVRFIAESLGCEVNWDAENQIVFLKSGKVSSAGDVFNLIKPTMVLIETESKLGKRGSGFFITENTILTNAHVVTGVYDIQVKASDGKYYSASVDKIDVDIDLAILKVQSSEKFKYIYQRKASKDIKEGQDVVAIGHPFGLENTVTSGIVSGFREEEGIKYIQMTAPISPGNSGGPLLTMDGEVVGINTLYISGGQNLNFAVPMDYYEKVKNSKALVLDAEVSKFIKAKSEWRAKVAGVDDDFKTLTKLIKEDKYAEASSFVKNKILPKIDSSRRAAAGFTTSNSEVRECVEEWVDAMDYNYDIWESLDKLFDNAASNAKPQFSKDSLIDLLEDASISDYLFEAKCERLWKKYYKQGSGK